MRGRLVAGLIVALGVAAPPASASTLSVRTQFEFVDGGGITFHDAYYTATPGEKNNLTVRETPDHTSIAFREAKLDIFIAFDSRLHPPTLNAQWGCASMHTSDALCTVQPHVPQRDCEIAGGCVDESGEPELYRWVIVQLNDGVDRVDAADGQPQTIVCANGDDTVIADTVDRVDGDCLQISRQ